MDEVRTEVYQELNKKASEDEKKAKAIEKEIQETKSAGEEDTASNDDKANEAKAFSEDAKNTRKLGKDIKASIYALGKRSENHPQSKGLI